MKKKILNLLLIMTVGVISFIGFKPMDVDAKVTQYGSIPNSNGKAYYEYDTDGNELRIRALNSATETAYVNGNITAKGTWPWNNLRSEIKKVTFTTGTSGYGVGFQGVANSMFEDMVNLEKVDFSGMGEIKATGIARMFYGCTKIQEIDMSMVKTNGNLSNMQNMFRDCKALTKVTLNNTGFKTRNVSDKQGAQLANMFNGCSSLSEVDMSNITLTGNSTSNRELDNPFTGSSVETIKMDNIKFNNVKSLDNFISGLSNLETVSMKGTVNASSVKTMYGMFSNNSKLKKLDISGFGKLNNILNMNDFIAGCKGLENLIIDNLDNSNIGPTNNRHTVTDSSDEDYISQEDARKIGAAEYGRELFGVGITNGGKHFAISEAFPKLKTISAKEANVWMCKNNRGLPGSEYYIAANNSDVLFFTNKDTTFKPDAGSEVEIDSKRDYIDLIIDRDGVNNHSFSPTTSSLPDSGTNINISGGDLNKLGSENFRPGKLAPGIYTIGDNEWKEDKIRPTGSYYRISYIGEVDYSIADTSNDKIEITETDGVHYINTKSMSKADWDAGKDGNGNYVIDCSGDKAIKITYKEAGQDIEGKKYDIELTINKITFKDINKIPVDPERGSHNGNNYIDDNFLDGNENPDKEYFRTILRASKADGVMFRNYVRVGDPTGYSGSGDNDGENGYSFKANSGGSGTDIDFSIKFKPASGNTEEIKDDKTFVFFVDDLDVAASQNWAYPKQDDPCYDTLEVDKATYGVGGEAFVLRDGVQLDTVTFADHTGLRVVNNNTVVTTGSDPSTSWSEFSVKADPKNSNFTWTSGIPCDTYALRNTIPPSNEIKVIKKWQDRGSDNSPRPDDLDFEIKYTKDNEEKTVVVPDTAVWDKTKANEWSMIFYDDANKFQPSGGYKATEVGPDKYDIVKGDTPLELKYNEDTGYFEVIFENKEQTKDVTVTKSWVDTDKQKDKRPNKIRLELIDDEGEVVKTYDLPSDKSSHTFTAPKYNKDGEEINYTVNEKEINSGDLKFYEKSISGMDITNTFKVPDEKFNIIVENTWDDNNNEKEKRPVKVVIQLFANGELLEDYEMNTMDEASYTFRDLDKYDENGNEIKYTVDEAEVNKDDLKYYLKTVGKMTDIPDTNDKKVKINNKYTDIPAKVIVKYIDKSTGKEIIKSEIIKGTVGSSYKVALKQISNYRFLESTDNTVGEMTEEDITVIYYYEPAEVAVTGLKYGIGPFMIIFGLSLLGIGLLKRKSLMQN